MFYVPGSQDFHNRHELDIFYSQCFQWLESVRTVLGFPSERLQRITERKSHIACHNLSQCIIR